MRSLRCIVGIHRRVADYSEPLWPAPGYGSSIRHFRCTRCQSRWARFVFLGKYSWVREA